MSNYFPDALKKLCPNSEFLIRGEYVLSNVEWVKLADSIPTEEQIKAEQINLEKFYSSKADIEQAKKLLAETDWVVVKITELNLNGLDVSDQYLDILSHRKLMREVINAKETEIANV